MGGEAASSLPRALSERVEEFASRLPRRRRSDDPPHEPHPRGKVAGVLGLLFLAVPVLAVGQLWAIAVLVARLDRSDRSARGSRWRINTADPRVFFEGLPPWQAFAVIVVFVLSWVAGATAFRHLGSGGPTSPTRGCPYRLVNHDEYSCVSRSTYIAAAAAEQRLASGAFLGFFVVQFGIAAAELRRRRGLSNDEEVQMSSVRL